MNYADRACYKARLQRNGAPAMIEEHTRAAERLTAIEERMAALEEAFALLHTTPGPCSPQAGCDCPPDTDTR